MLRPAAGPLRVVRASVVGSTIVGLSAAAHHLAGGELPPVPVIAALVAVLTCMCPTVLGRRLTVGALIALLGLGQVGLHYVLAALTGTTTHLVVDGAVGHHGAVPGLASLAGTHAVHLHSTAPSMLVAHGAATVVTAMLLAAGDRALWWTAAWLRPLLALVTGGARRVPSVPRTPPATAHVVTLREVTRRLAEGRGPPTGASLAFV